MEEGGRGECTRASYEGGSAAARWLMASTAASMSSCPVSSWRRLAGEVEGGQGGYTHR